MCFLRKFIEKEIKKIMNKQLTPFEVDVYLDSKIKDIDSRVEQLETNSGTNIDGVTFLELKSITTQPVTSVQNDLYWNSTDKKIYKKGVSTWGSSDVGNMGAIYKHGTKYYRYKNLGDLGLDATVERELLEIGEPVKYFNDLNASGDIYLENLSVKTIDVATLTVANKIVANGGVDFKTKKAENLADPTADQDGATKKYVDNLTTPEIVLDNKSIVFQPDYVLSGYLSLSDFIGSLHTYIINFKDGGNDIKILGTFIVDIDTEETFFTFSYYSVAKSGIVMYKVHIYNGVDGMYISIDELTELAPTITVPVITIKRLIK